MTITAFVSDNRDVRPNADIQERWASRVEKNMLHTRGSAGADAYIGQFGKGMKAPKAVMFARMAEIKGFPEMATRFWEHAFFMATGQMVSLASDATAPTTPVSLHPVALKESFGQAPELPVPIGLAEAMRLAEDDRYGVGEKVDGRHLLARVKSGVASFGNKRGLLTVPQLTITDAVLALGRDVELDGENIMGVYHAFDLLSLDSKDLRHLDCLTRYRTLETLILGAQIPNLRLVKMETHRAAKLALIAELQARGKEGFILKPLDTDYREGEHGMRKHQFRAMNTFLVGERNGDKNSVAISVYRSDGTLRDMGNLTIPGKAPIPVDGSVVEVEYLYCHLGESGKLHQPVFKEVRDDVTPSDCQESKIKLKAVSDE